MQAGFSLDEIRALLRLGAPGKVSCSEVREIAAHHLEDVRAKLSDLNKLERLLAKTVARCSGKTVPDCSALRYSIYLASYILVAAGFLLIAYAWRVLYEAQRANKLARSGPYSWVRHPQYLGFILVMFGLLLTWPALSTAIIFPVMTFVYVRLARIEERNSVELFGDAYHRYSRETPAFFPRFSRLFGRS